MSKRKKKVVIGGGFFVPGGNFFKPEIKCRKNPVEQKKSANQTIDLDEKYEAALQDLKLIKANYDKTEAAPVVQTPIPTSGKMIQQPGSLEQKLQIAETVMKKLYQRSMKLEKELENERKEKPQEVLNIIEESRPTEETVVQFQQQEEDYLRFLAEEQDRTIQNLREKIATLEDSSGSKGKPSGNSSSVVAKLSKKLKEVTDECGRQKANHQRLKHDYIKLRKSRVRNISGDPDIARHTKEFITLLEQRLGREEEERELEGEALSAKLYEMEQKECNAYVEKRMMETEIAKLSAEQQRRDVMDKRIEMSMAQVFERLRAVESENVRLREEK